MSKKFRTQDHFRYKRLGKRWRRPKGLQSKLRKGRGGSGKKPAIGRKKQAKITPLLVKSIKDMKALAKDTVVIVSSAVGVKKAIMILKEAEKLGLKVLNKNKIKSKEFLLKKKQELNKKAREEKKKKTEEAKKEKTEKKESKKEEDEKDVKKDEPELEEAKKEKSEATVKEEKETGPAAKEKTNAVATVKEKK